jgi:hypothetical protein
MSVHICTSSAPSGSPYDSGTVVASASAEVVSLPEDIPADESLGYNDLLVLDGHLPFQVFPDIEIIGLAVLVYPHEVQRRDQGRGYPNLGKEEVEQGC